MKIDFVRLMDLVLVALGIVMFGMSIAKIWMAFHGIGIVYGSQTYAEAYTIVEALLSMGTAGMFIALAEENGA